MPLGLILFIFLLSTRVEAFDLPPVKEVFLKNGMTFLLVPHGEAPIFSATVRFRVGGMDEDPARTGLAHFLEHMAFKGTEEIEGTDLARRIEEEGGEDDNASTSKDTTTYQISFPSDRLRFWAEIEAERIFHPVFREFEQEKKVVMEERRMRVEDDPDGRLYEELIRKAFAGTPYEWPTIGRPGDLQNLTEQDLVDFYRRHYQPSSAVAVLVGKFDLPEAEKIIRATFGRIPGKKAPPTLSVPPGLTVSPKPQGEEARFELKLPARSRVLIGYPKPTLPAREDYVFDVIDEILTGGRSSRLYHRLVIEKKVVAEVSSSNGVPGVRGPNLFLAALLPLDHSPDEVLKAFDEEVERLQREGPAEKEMEKAVNRLTVSLLWSLRTNEGLASELSYFAVTPPGWRYLKNYLDQIETITAADVREVANRYLRKNSRVVGMVKP